MRTRTEVKADIEKYESIDREALEEYDEFLDEVSEPVRIGSLEYLPSSVLKEIDEVAYDQGYNDWADGILRELYDELEGAENDEERVFYCAVSHRWDDDESDDYYLEASDDLDFLSPGVMAELHGQRLGVVQIKATSREEALEEFKAKYPMLEKYSDVEE